MKYNVGDEVLLKVKIVSIDNNSTSRLSVKVELPEELGFWIAPDEIVGVVEAEMPDTELEITELSPNLNLTNPAIENAYNTGLNDAWELAKKIGVPSAEGGMHCNDVYKVFKVDTCWRVFANFTPQEALAKMKAYEEAQIEVGDVVELPVGTKCVVTSVKNDRADGFTEIGYSYYDLPLDELKKTGKHIDIKSILEQIGE